MDNLDAEKDVLRSDPDKIAVIFEDMIQMCLWCVPHPVLLGETIITFCRGNATVGVHVSSVALH